MKVLTKHTLRIYWNHAKQYPWALFAITFSLVAGAAFEIYIPFWYKRFFDILAVNDTGLAQDLIHIILVILGLQFANWAVRRVGHITNNYFRPRVMSDLKNMTYEYLHKHSNNFFDNSFAGSLVRRVNRFARSFHELADTYYHEIGRTTVYLVFILFVVFIRYWQLGALILGWVILFVVLNFMFSRYKLKFDLERVAQDTRTTGHLADTIGNQYNIKLFSTLAYELKSFKKHTEKLFNLQRFTWNLREYADAVQIAFMILLEFAVFYIAIGFWQQGLITIGEFVLLQAYLGKMFHHLWGLGRHIHRVYESLSEAEETTQILMTPHDVQDVEDTKRFKVSEGELKFNNVTFGYPGYKPVFKNFSITIKPGERVAIIGPSGGGKSTFVKLLFRFFDIQKGEVLIDDQNIAEVKQETLRNNIGLVPQDPILFHRTLMENIRYGKRSAANDEVVRAAKLAHCHEFISKFPDQYQTYVGERGVKLSGGERQRVAIARAMLEDAPILVLDEATSSLDSESEKFIQDALDTLMKGKTTIVIAHRLSTIMKMDRIIVIENGTITEEGTHKELLSLKKGTYQKLWDIQAGGFAG